MALKDELFEQYGRLLNSEDICRELRYPSVGALRAANRRGRLPFQPVKIEGRTGIYALSSDVAQILEAAIASATATRQPERRARQDQAANGNN